MPESIGSSTTSVNQRLRKWARSLKSDVLAMYLAVKHPRIPWYAKAFAGLVVGYALSPIDLIPDFIPVLGYLDDVILLPLGIALAVKLMPKDVLSECRRTAMASPTRTKPRIVAAAYIIVAVWLSLAYGLYQWLM